MRRADLLKITELTNAAFNNLAARDLLPFTPKTRASTWGDYSADDALRLALMVKLSESGWSQASAVKTVRSGYGALKEAAKTAGKMKPWFLGSAWVSVAKAEGPVTRRRSVIARQGEVEGVTAAFCGEGDELSHWAVVNATAVIKRLNDRASEEGVSSARLSALADLLGAHDG